MSLRDQLARRRIPLGFLCGVIVLWLARPTRTTMLVGVPVAAVGEFLRIWAAGHLYKSREVTASGPYRWLAHPLYVGSSIIGIGLAIAGGSLVVALVIAAYLAATLSAAIHREEAFLRRTFGDGYDRFRREGQVDRRRRFRLEQAFANREHRALVGFALAVLLLVLKATYNGLFWRSAGPQ